MHGWPRWSPQTENTQHPHRQPHPFPPADREGSLLAEPRCLDSPPGHAKPQGSLPLLVLRPPLTTIHRMVRAKRLPSGQPSDPWALQYPSPRPVSVRQLASQTSYPSCCWSGLKFTRELCALTLTYIHRGLKFPGEMPFSTCWCLDVPYWTDIPSPQSISP